jgi:hypothetical protein
MHKPEPVIDASDNQMNVRLTRWHRVVSSAARGRYDRCRNSRAKYWKRFVDRCMMSWSIAWFGSARGRVLSWGIAWFGSAPYLQYTHAVLGHCLLWLSRTTCTVQGHSLFWLSSVYVLAVDPGCLGGIAWFGSTPTLAQLNSGLFARSHCPGIRPVYCL